MTLFKPPLTDVFSTGGGNYEYNPLFAFLLDQAWVKQGTGVVRERRIVPAGIDPLPIHH